MLHEQEVVGILAKHVFAEGLALFAMLEFLIGFATCGSLPLWELSAMAASSVETALGIT